MYNNECVYKSTFVFKSLFSSVNCSIFCLSSVFSNFKASTSAVSGPDAPKCCFKKLNFVKEIQVLSLLWYKGLDIKILLYKIFL